MAHVQRKTGRPRPWIARYVGPDGREHSRSFTRKLDADRFCSSIEGGKLRGEWTDPALGRIQVEQWAERWLLGVTPTLKPKTAESYASLLRSRILPTFAGWQLTALRPSDVQEWIGTMQADGVSPSRIRQAHVVLRRMLEVAALDGRIGRNAADGARLPRLGRTEAPFLEPELVEKIALEMSPPYDLLVRILGRLGPRFGEAAALRRRSVDLVGRRLVISESLAEVSGRHFFGTTKSHATRRVPLTRGLATELEALLAQRAPDSSALVFTSPQGSALRHSSFRSRCWLPALERAGLPQLGIHVLRHSAAAAMIRSGASPKTVQTVLGHASAAFTLTVYGHIFEADLDDLAERLEVAPSTRVASISRVER